MELKLKNDIVFKAFFAKKGNERFLKSFLESLLKEKIDNIKIQGEVSLLQMNKEDKLGRLELKATINQRKVIDIEIQLEDRKNTEKRSVYYGAKLVTEQIGKGDEYIETKPVILINILNYNLLDVPEYYTKTVTVAELHRDYEVIKDATYYFIELPKFGKSKPKLANLLECWLALIDGENRGLIEMAESKNEIIKEANEEVEEILSESQIKELNDYLFTARLERNSIKGNAMREGIEKGIKRANTKIVKRLYEKNISIEQIIEITELTEEEIRKIIKQ